MERSNRSPVMTYKIALVNNANLNQVYVDVPGTAQDAIMDEDGVTVLKAAVPARQIKQFEYASKRLQRAIRKARKIAQAGNRAVMLFCQRENGQHFPVNYRKPQFEMKNEPPNMGARLALRSAIPGMPIEEQKPHMALFRAFEARPDLLFIKKEA